MKQERLNERQMLGVLRAMAYLILVNKQTCVVLGWCELTDKWGEFWGLDPGDEWFESIGEYFKKWPFLITSDDRDEYYHMTHQARLLMLATFYVFKGVVP